MAEQKIKITLDIFSGRENPVIEFTGKRIGDITERLAPSHRLEEGIFQWPPIPMLHPTA